MSLKGLEESEKIAAQVQRNIEKSFKKQQKELKEELAKVEYLLGDKDALLKWRNDLADSQKIATLNSMLNDVERLYLNAGNTQAAQVFKDRMQKQLQQRLTNLKANELELKLRVTKQKLQNQNRLLTGMNEIKQDAHFREMYAQSREAGGFLSNFGRPYLGDLVTLETKAAGSKTLGKYMTELYNRYEAGLKDVFINGIIRGDSYAQMEKNLMHTTGVTAGKARLLVRTESNAIFNESVREVIDDNPLVKGYRFRAVLDSHTSDICQKHDGEYIPKEDVKPGENYPPLHPNCRSTVITVLVDEDEKKDTSQRYTKNGKNQWIKVPPGTTYPEYKRMFETHIQYTYTQDGPFSSTVRRELYVSPDDNVLVQVGESKIAPNVIASASLMDGEMSERISPEARRLYQRARDIEPRITDTMMAIADNNNGKLDGIEFAVKTGSSTEGKIARKKQSFIEAGKPVPSDEEIVGGMGDLVRYTVVVDHDDIATSAQDTLEKMQLAGINVLELDNKYVKEGATYKGVHLEGMLEGQKFEVQIHSKQSLELKAKLHPMYEKARAVGTDPETAKELNEAMIRLSKGLPNPKGIENLKGFKR